MKAATTRIVFPFALGYSAAASFTLDSSSLGAMVSVARLSQIPISPRIFARVKELGKFRAMQRLPR
jgi:hypothetical protein